MKSGLKAALVASLIYSAICASAWANTVVLVDFSSPSTLLQGAGTATRTLGESGTYSFGTWIYSAVGEIDLSGSGVARIRNNTSSNARAISVIFNPSLFTAGTQYTLAFDVIGQTSTSNTGRFWLAELSGYGAGGSVLTNVAPGTGTWATNTSPFTSSGSAMVSYLGGMASTGVTISGENTTGTTSTTLNFTYSAGTAIAFAVGTYDNIFSIDNVSITAISAVPEPSTYALFAGAAALSLAIYRRRRRVNASAHTLP